MKRWPDRDYLSLEQVSGTAGVYYCLGHQGNRVASRVFSFALPLSPSSACSTCSLPRPRGWDHDRKRMIAHMGRGESPVICFFKKTEVFGTAPGAKLKLMLATLPAWLPSPPEGRVSAALNPGRSLACHRGRWARGCNSQGPGTKLNPVQMLKGP